MVISRDWSQIEDVDNSISDILYVWYVMVFALCVIVRTTLSGR